MKIEYKVRPRGGAFITRFESGKDCMSSSVVGEFSNHDLATTAAKALAASELGATCSTNILGTPDGTAADLLRNLADQYGSATVDGLVILLDAKGEVSVFGLGRHNECNPQAMFRKGAEKMRELGGDVMFLCLFRPHRWEHIFNAGPSHLRSLDGLYEFGVYQCTRCKSISTGSVRE